MSKKRADEKVLYGKKAVMSFFENSSEAIVRVYIVKSLIHPFKKLIEHCVHNKKAYHLVETEELEKITRSTHHEGVAILAKFSPMALYSQSELKGWLKQNSKFLVASVDGVENPHNIGGILRSAAHFGVKVLFLPAAKNRDENFTLPSSLYRVAEGGAEKVNLRLVENWEKFFSDLKLLGFENFYTSSHQGKDIYDMRFSNYLHVMFGNEANGVDIKMMKLLGQGLKISGTGAVESLNVSVAAALIFGEIWRQTNYNQ
jgi:TrmH RNA methyltransferase